MDVLKIIAKRICNLRKEKNYSQEKLAELSELHKNYIGSIERLEKTPSIITLYKIAKALDITLEKLVKDID